MTGQWIAVAKKLPKWGHGVIVAYRRYKWSNRTHKYRKLNKLGVSAATYWGDNWPNGPRFASGQDDIVNEPVAWMPMPEPPEVK
jgi:hypothetical protein